MAFGAPTNGLGALESNGLGSLNCPFKMALKMGALQNPHVEAWYAWHTYKLVISTFSVSISHFNVWKTMCI